VDGLQLSRVAVHCCSCWVQDRRHGLHPILPCTKDWGRRRCIVTTVLPLLWTGTREIGGYSHLMFMTLQELFWEGLRLCRNKSGIGVWTFSYNREQRISSFVLCTIKNWLVLYSGLFFWIYLLEDDNACCTETCLLLSVVHSQNWI